MSLKFVTKDGRTGRLRPATENDAEALIQAVDSVAREMVYFLRSRFELDVEKERIFIAEAAERGNLMLLAELDGRIVGWVTLFRARAEFLQHTAELGMGVLGGYRGIGIGTALMEHALKWAREQSFEKINLGVRASNERARALYRKFGFVEEGYRVQEIKDLEGRYDDSVEMAVFVVPGPSSNAEGEGD
jgi:ribosomal protein S18 acetylase RimI-like enzyme